MVYIKWFLLISFDRAGAGGAERRARGRRGDDQGLERLEGRADRQGAAGGGNDLERFPI